MPGLLPGVSSVELVENRLSVLAARAVVEGEGVVVVGAATVEEAEELGEGERV